MSSIIMDSKGINFYILPARTSHDLSRSELLDQELLISDLLAMQLA